jgi:hypothetical protein
MKSGVRRRGGQGEVMDCDMVGMDLDMVMDMGTIRDMDMGVMVVKQYRDGGRVGI